MPTTRTDIFDLSESRTAKADPALIGTDQTRLRIIAERLSEQVTATSDQLATERRSPGGGGQAALERDQRVHRLTTRLRLLHRYGMDLCLGRMVRAGDTGPVYIGRIGLTDQSGEVLMVDWRAPAAEPFFAATHANPMGLTSRRRYRWSAGRITDYWDEVFAPGALQGHAALDDQSAFIASLGASRTGAMPDVLSTIQGDQDAIIRAGSRGPLVVDGGPGTGKTVVALHRAAYLLYSDPRMGVGSGGVLVVGPHQPYLSYVADVLPSLGEEGVLTCTLTDLAGAREHTPAERDPVVAGLKASGRMAGTIEKAVAFYEQPPAESLEVSTSWADVQVTDADWVEAFAAPDPGTPHNEAREQVWDALVRLLIDQHDSEVPADLVRREVSRDTALTATLNHAWPLLSAPDLIGDLWSVPAYLRMCAPWLGPEQVRALQRQDPHAWTQSDLPLLDAARHRLGEAGDARRRRRQAATTQAERDQMDAVVTELIAADHDGEGVMTMLHGADLRDALVQDAADGVAGADRLAGPFAHIVVDEAQELTEAQWQMLLRRCPSRSFTIVGDRAQARDGFTESWSQRLHRAGLGEARVATLSLNYRTPAEVMSYAEPVIRTVLPDANVPRSVRSNGLPVRHGHTSELQAVLQEWAAAHAEGVGCVISTRPPSPPLPRSRVLSLTPELAKGLEFDLVVLINPEGFGVGVQGGVDRYVAMTRATQQLVVLTDSAP